MRRRTFLSGVLGAASTGAVLAATNADATPSAGKPTGLPTVDMEATLRAAQIDPRRPGTETTSGAEASVLLVERALADRGLLESRYVDGSFGTRTIAAYAEYQNSLGYSGLAANGLPGRASLQKLGDGRYTVTRPLSPGAKVTFDGVTVNERTRAMLRRAQQSFGRTLVLTQGSYNPGGDASSAGTHDGGGVVDLSVRGISDADRTALVRALRVVGFAAWLRTPDQADWPFHIHAVAINDSDLSTQAQHQVGDYYLGLNGLRGRGKDDGPRIQIKTWEDYQRSR